MNISKIVFGFFVVIAGASPAFAQMSTQLGVGYGKEFRDNKDLEQYEIFWRQPLPYKTILGDSWKISTDVELGGALIRERHSDNDGTGRFSLTPEVIVSPHRMVNFIFGVGAGFMVGNTEFTDHNLGGHFLLTGKAGVQLLLGDHWGLEYVYFHQSNAGIYDYNASLNMNQVAFVYNF